ncbi:hypothetical protein RKJ46_29095 [Klebsiella pneumoniae]|nr:hypothetical protein [Klebsiella pneumoniae]
MTLYSKAKSYEAGERVEFGGKSFAPLYTPKNDTLINLFQISQQEQEQLKTIISTDEAQKRRRERDRLRVMKNVAAPLASLSVKPMKPTH